MLEHPSNRRSSRNSCSRKAFCRAEIPPKHEIPPRFLLPGGVRVLKVPLRLVIALEEWAIAATKLKATWDQEITTQLSHDLAADHPPVQLLRLGHNTTITGTTSMAMLKFRKRINEELEEKSAGCLLLLRTCVF